ncbi:MAG TPA: hypothetical protein VNJ03_08780, partial [Vicinamibacterales bacterium]|nr:hypothetical protein [Vicinamibacterales bacterium]
YSANPEASTRSLATNFGYYFTVKGVAYVVLGPAALDPRGPVFTRLSSGHELFHAEHHVGDPRPLEDRELETWTAMFVNYFHDIHPFRQRWAPMVSYYEQANPVEQKIALDKLVAYYRAPPASVETKSDSAAVGAAFTDWVARRKKDAETSSSKLVRDLEAAIGSPAPAREAVRRGGTVEVSGPVRIATRPDGQRLLISVGDTDAYSVILSNAVMIDAGDWFQSPVTFPSGRVHFGETGAPFGRLTVTLENGRRLTFYMAGDDLSAADRKANDTWEARGFAHYPAPKHLDALEKMVFAQK